VSRRIAGELLYRFPAVSCHIHLGASHLKNAYRNLCIHLIILSHKDIKALIGKVFRIFRLRRLFFILCFRFLFICDRKIQKYHKIRALSWHAVYDDLAVHQAHHLIGDCHAKAGASIFLDNIRALLLKGTEYPADEFRLHSNSRIMDAHHQIYPSVFLKHLAERYPNLALAGKFYGI